MDAIRNAHDPMRSRCPSASDFTHAPLGTGEPAAPVFPAPRAPTPSSPLPCSRGQRGSFMPSATRCACRGVFRARPLFGRAVVIEDVAWLLGHDEHDQVLI